MTKIKIICVGRWNVISDYEGLSDRLGPTQAEIVWDTVAARGYHVAGNGLVYVAVWG